MKISYCLKSVLFIHLKDNELMGQTREYITTLVDNNSAISRTFCYLCIKTIFLFNVLELKTFVLNMICTNTLAYNNNTNTHPYV